MTKIRTRDTAVFAAAAWWVLAAGCSKNRIGLAPGGPYNFHSREYTDETLRPQLVVDGRPAFEKTDFKFRNVDTLKIETVWMNIYHGGSDPMPQTDHLYFDNIVIATRYIGPMYPP